MLAYCRVSVDRAELHTSSATCSCTCNVQVRPASLVGNSWRSLRILEENSVASRQDTPVELAYWPIRHILYWLIGYTAAGIWAEFKKGVVDYHPISDIESSSLNSSMQKLCYTSLEIFIKCYLSKLTAGFS